VKNWNIHSTWIIGILLAILICSTSVDWNAINDLPGIISFAVGLSSLILAVIAIFQTLSSTGSVEASLAAVRQATEGSARVSEELAASTAIIQKAATDAQAAASSAMTATSNFSAISANVIESNHAGTAAVSRLLEEISTKSVDPVPNGQPDALVEPKKYKIGSMGGTTVMYAAIRSFEEKKPFSFSEIFTEDASTSWEKGYISCLADNGHLALKRDNGDYAIISMNIGDLAPEKARLKGRKYGGDGGEDFARRIAQIDAFFAPEN
jgi:hypothetical protein